MDLIRHVYKRDKGLPFANLRELRLRVSRASVVSSPTAQMKTSYDRGKSSKSQTIKANETIPSCCSRNGNHHEKQSQSTLRQAHPKNHGGNTVPSQTANMLPGWRGAQMSDVCNGNLTLGHGSDGISCTTSEELPHGVTNANKEGVPKKGSATQKVRDEPKDSPSKAVFTFWANKVNNSSKVPTFQKSPVSAGRCSPALHPKEGFSILEGEKQAKSHQRKTRRDFFSDSKVFSHIDTHVLHVSQQVGPDVLQREHRWYHQHIPIQPFIDDSSDKVVPYSNTRLSHKG